MPLRVQLQGKEGRDRRLGFEGSQNCRKRRVQQRRDRRIEPKFVFDNTTQLPRFRQWMELGHLCRILSDLKTISSREFVPVHLNSPTSEVSDSFSFLFERSLPWIGCSKVVIVWDVTIRLFLREIGFLLTVVAMTKHEDTIVCKMGT